MLFKTSFIFIMEQYNLNCLILTLNISFMFFYNFVLIWKDKMQMVHDYTILKLIVQF